MDILHNLISAPILSSTHVPILCRRSLSSLTDFVIMNPHFRLASEVPEGWFQVEGPRTLSEDLRGATLTQPRPWNHISVQYQFLLVCGECLGQCWRLGETKIECLISIVIAGVLSEKVNHGVNCIRLRIFQVFENAL